MADKAFIASLIDQGMDHIRLGQAQHTAAGVLAGLGLPAFPTNACAATLSALLQQAGIDVPMIISAGQLAHKLGGKINSRGWDHIPVGQQAPGDIGVTYDQGGNPGADHIYLVLETPDGNRMLIADNQSSVPHTRYANGLGGKTPTEYFLRAT